MDTLFSRLPYVITGDDYATLKKYDVNSRKKISSLGWLVVIPVFTWFITGYLVAANILSTGVYVAFLTGGIAAFIIFIFEHSIVHSKKVKWPLVTFRIIMGICIALFSSMILDLIFFKNDIQHFAESQILVKQEARVDTAHAETIRLMTAYTGEMDGQSGSRNKGYGPISKEKYNLYKEAEQKELKEELKLKDMKGALANPDSQEYKVLVDQLGMNTILNRLKLLDDLAVSNKKVLFIWLLFIIIGGCLEFMCILTKLWSDRTAYEEDVEAYEIILAHKREQILQQSIFYTKMGVDGRGIGNNNVQNKHTILI
jgi:hypothetical protein